LARRVAGAACWLGPVALALACGRSRAGPTVRATPETAARADTARPTGNRAGAIDSLGGRDLADRHVDEIAELLQGRVPGLQVIRQPNGDISLRIRGGDIALDNSAGVGEPLVIIDGMPVTEGRLSSVLRALNPRDIARIEVLKDVSSTSIYGVRGAHGVILITMKRD